MGTIVKVGIFGEIKKLMKSLSKRDMHADMKFICGEGDQQKELNCHRFIIGAQSVYLKDLMKSVPVEYACEIYLPDIDVRHMEVVLQFLYTGKLKLRADIIKPVRELLQRILKIDADFKLPTDEAINGLQNGNSRKDRDGDSGKGSPRSSPSSSSDYSSDPSSGPPKKRFCSSSNNSSNQNNGVEDSLYTKTPMSPPHQLESVNSDDEDIQVILPPTKTPPPVVDLSENEDELEANTLKSSEHTSSEISNEEDSSQLKGLSFPPAPKVIAKRSYFAKKSTTTSRARTECSIAEAPKIICKSTGGAFNESNNSLKSKSIMDSLREVVQRQSAEEISNGIIPKAPKIVAKSTGGFRRYNISRDSTESEKDVTEITQTSEVIASQDGSKPFIINYHGEKELPSANKSSDRPRSQRSSAINRMDFSAFMSDEEDDDRDNNHDRDFVPIHNTTPTAPSTVPYLPPPIPQAPEPGLVLYRGDWMKQSKVQKIKHRTEMKNQMEKGKRIKKYNPSLFSITGKTLAATAVHREEPEGIYECIVCGDKFAKMRSLDVHFSRNHNPKATVECPEKCGKRFTSQSAIKKHLLSHRPQHEWPYECEFCKKRFQARADLPKHYNTALHKDDPNVPKQGTPEWTALMQRCEVIPWKSLKSYNPDLTQPSQSTNNLQMPQMIQIPTPPTHNNLNSSTSSVDLILPEQNITTDNAELDQNVITNNDAEIVASAVNALSSSNASNQNQPP